jgi:hypothetical protein
MSVDGNRCLSAADERNIGSHDGHELDIRVQRKTAHVNNRIRYVLQIHPRFQNHLAIRLQSCGRRFSAHIAGVANIDLAAGDGRWRREASHPL